jgi:hypothetical protein
MKTLGYTNNNGYKVWINPDQSNGVDLKIWHNDELVLVAEIINWSIKSRMAMEKKRWKTDNLTAYNCKKLLIHTAFFNESILEDLPDYGISAVRIGFQILPKHFYDFYLAKNQVEARRIDSRKATEEIKTVLARSLFPS